MHRRPMLTLLSLLTLTVPFQELEITSVVVLNQTSGWKHPRVCETYQDQAHQHLLRAGRTQKKTEQKK